MCFVLSEWIHETFFFYLITWNYRT